MPSGHDTQLLSAERRRERTSTVDCLPLEIRSKVWEYLLRDLYHQHCVALVIPNGQAENAGWEMFRKDTYVDARSKTSPQIADTVSLMHVSGLLRDEVACILYPNAIFWPWTVTQFVAITNNFTPYIKSLLRSACIPRFDTIIHEFDFSSNLE